MTTREPLHNTKKIVCVFYCELLSNKIIWLQRVKLCRSPIVSYCFHNFRQDRIPFVASAIVFKSKHVLFNRKHNVYSEVSDSIGSPKTPALRDRASTKMLSQPLICPIINENCCMSTIQCCNQLDNASNGVEKSCTIGL